MLLESDVLIIIIQQSHAITIANSIQIRTDRPTDRSDAFSMMLESDALILMQTASRSNQTFFLLQYTFRTDRSDAFSMMLESDALIIIQRLQSHALPDRPTDRQEH